MQKYRLKMIKYIKMLRDERNHLETVVAKKFIKQENVDNAKLIKTLILQRDKMKLRNQSAPSIKLKI